MQKNHSRFSRKSVIDRYFKKPHGYVAIACFVAAIMYYFNGPHDFSHSGGGPTYMTSKLLTPIFGRYAKAGLFLILTVAIIIDAEFKFNKK